MRVDLGEGPDALVLLSPESLIEFRDEWEARAFLALLMHEPGNMEALRHALAEETSPLDVMRLSDHEVVNAVAARLARACVAFARQHRQQTAPPTDAARGAGGGAPAAAPAPLAQEDEPTPVDTKPDPVIPPVYPAVAAQESAALLQETDLLNVRLEMLKHLRDSAAPLSEVAGTFRAMVGAQRSALAEATVSLSIQLAGLNGDPPLPPPPSEVAKAFGVVTQAQVKTISELTESLWARLLRMALKARDRAEQQSEVGEVMVDLARVQGRAMSAGASRLIAQLKSIT